MRTLTQSEVEQLAGGVQWSKAQQVRDVMLGASFSAIILETHISGALIKAVVGGPCLFCL